jgi:tetratricopeptide (TPR) repeat protein
MGEDPLDHHHAAGRLAPEEQLGHATRGEKSQDVVPTDARRNIGCADNSLGHDTLQYTPHMGSARRIVVLVIVATASVASAQPSQNDRDRALVLFRESDVHYKRGDFERAVALLREAYELHPEPILLYNLARALEGLGDFDGAIELYERYLNAETEIHDRGAIERRIATLREQVARTAQPPVTSDAPTGTPVSDNRTAPPAGDAMTPIRLEPPPSEMQRKPPRLPWLIAGGGGVVLGGGVLLGYVSQARHDAAVDEPIQAEAQKLQDQARTFATAANVALAVGGAAVIGGVTWAVISRRQHRDAPRLGIGPGTINATWVFE